MSRIGKAPIPVPGGVTVTVQGTDISVKGPKGELAHTLHAKVSMTQEGNELRFGPSDASQDA